MTVKRDPDAILAAWLDEGPVVLPEPTRRAIAVSIRNAHRSRLPDWLPWRAPNMNGMTRLALAAVAVVAVVIGGLVVLRPGTDRSGGVGGPASPVPSASTVPSTTPAPSDPASPAASIPAMTQAFTSPTFGYSLRYPADWVASPTSADGPSSTGQTPSTKPMGRGGSGCRPSWCRTEWSIDDWISQNLTYSTDADCARPRNTLEQVIIDGHAGRLRGFCGNPPATEIESTVVVDNRVYLFTMFWFVEGTGAVNEAEVRSWFDAFTATMTLDPGSAGGSPKPSPS